MRIFDSPVYVHILIEKRNKLEPSSEKGIFVGYKDVSEAYKVYIPGQKRFIVS